MRGPWWRTCHVEEWRQSGVSVIQLLIDIYLSISTHQLTPSSTTITINRSLPVNIMVPTQILQKLVQEKYRPLGTDKKGNFIGEDLYREKLTSYYANTKDAQALDKASWKLNLAEIRRLVHVFVF